MRVWWLAAAGLVVIGLAVAGFALVGPGFAAKQNVQYLSAAASVADVKAQVVANGTLQPARTFSLAFGSPVGVTLASATSTSGATTSGSGNSSATGPAAASVRWTVSSVSVVVGQHVKAGDPLASAGTADLDAQIAVATAQVADAKVQVAAGGTALAVANANLALFNARALLADLRAARAHASLVAPEAGIVTAVNVTKGLDAPSGAAVVIASDAVVATAVVTETDVASIKADQPATITITALGSDVTGTVSSVATTGSASSGVVGFGVAVGIDSVPTEVRPGMSVQVTVVTAQALGVLSIPSVALNGSLGSYTVSILASDGTTESRSVGTGLVTTDLAEITQGLTAGERVVTGTASTQLTTTNTGGFRGGFGGGGFGGGGFGGGGN